MAEKKIKIVAVLLAGGQSRRMGGGDKCLQKLANKALLSHVINRIRPQVDCMIINANGDPKRFSEFGLEVVPDVVSGQLGPLAGILTGLDWVSSRAPDIEWIVSIPTDAPFLPSDLVKRLFLAAEIAAGKNCFDLDQTLFPSNGDIAACVASLGRRHPVIGLWPVASRMEMRRKLLEDDIRKIDIFTEKMKLGVAEFDPINGSSDPFLNINSPNDLFEAERILKQEFFS